MKVFVVIASTNPLTNFETLKPDLTVHSSNVVVCVRHDFQLAWNHTVSAGAVALHDYGGDLPEVTATIDLLKIQFRGLGKPAKLTARPWWNLGRES
jgi:hypothetical protein